MTATPDANHSSLPPGSAEARDGQLDNQLAELTDAQLRGQTVNPASVDPELSELVKVSHQLKTFIADDPGPSAAFRAQLTRKLTEEWDRERFRRRTNWPRVIRLSALAATLILVMGVAALWLNSPTKSGFDAGPLTLQFFVVMAVIGVGAIAAIIVFSLTRRK